MHTSMYLLCVKLLFCMLWMRCFLCVFGLLFICVLYMFSFVAATCCASCLFVVVCLSSCYLFRQPRTGCLRYVSCSRSP